MGATALGRALRLAAAVAFLTWAVVFIARSSFLMPDGRRYFSLFDDAMISMRYAWNLSHGHGLVWNPGQPVEGYTNLLMTLLMAAATAVFDQRTAVLAIQVIGIPTVLGVAYTTDRLAQRLVRPADNPWRDFVGAAAFASILAYYPLLYWSLMGMETGLVTLLTTGGLVLSFRPRLSARSAVGASVLLALAYLTRADSAVLALPILAYVTFRLVTQEGSRDPRTVIVLLLIFAVTIVATEVFRVLYYGDLVPNTYRLKIGGYPLVDRLQNGILFIRGFVGEVFPLIVVMWASWLFAWSKEKGIAACVALFVLAYQVWAGGDAWDYWRMLVPMMPILVAGFLVEAEAILTQLSPGIAGAWRAWTERNPIASVAPGGGRWASIAQRAILVAGIAGLLGLIAIPVARWVGIGSSDIGPRKLALLAICLGLASLLIVAGRSLIWRSLAKAGVPMGLAVFALWAMWRADGQFIPEFSFTSPALQVVNNHENLLTALALRDVTDETASVGVSWAGLIPYYTGRPAVDFLGKSDRTIASLLPDLSGTLHEEGMSAMPGHNKYDLTYSIQRLRPTYVQTCQFARQNLCPWVAAYYVNAEYQGVQLLLLKGSPAVHWGMLQIHSGSSTSQ